jgi:hypothetical protein
MWMSNGQNETIFANTANIGIGGLCAHLNQGVSLGTRVDIQLNFTNSSTPFKCRGVVVRSVKGDDKFYNTGIEFEPLNEVKLAFLNGKISELIDLEKKGQS